MIREALQSIINESVNPQILKYAEVMGDESTDRLRDLVNKEYGILNPPPKMDSRKVKNVKQLIKEYNSRLKTHPNEMKILFDIVPKGVGRAEVMLSYLHDEISIGGGSQNYDVDFWNNQIEVKEVKISGDYGGNFRLGVDSTYLLKKAYEDLVDLYEVARHYIPEINNDKFSDNVHKKGGIALSALRNWKIPKDVEVKEVNLKIQKDGYVLNDGIIVGNLKDKDIIKNIKKMFDVAKDVKSFEQIERELEKGLSEHDMKYFFFGDLKKGIPLYYKEKIDDIRIESATGNKVKFQIKLK